MEDLWNRAADLTCNANKVTVYDLEKEIFKLCIEAYGKGFNDAKNIPVHLTTET